MWVSKKYLIYILGLGAWMIGYLFKIQTTFTQVIGPELDLLRKLGLLIIFFWLCFYGFKRNIKKSGLITISAFILYFIISRRVGDSRYFEEVFIIISAFFVPEEKMHNILLGLFSVMSLTPIICAKIGLIENIYWMGRSFQDCMGFSYYSFGSHLLFVWMVLYLLKKGENVKLRVWIVLLVLNQVIYAITSLATPYYLTWLLFMLWVITSIFQTKIIQYVAIVAVPGMAIISIVVSYFYEKIPVFFRLLLGPELNNRMWLAHNGLHNNGFSILGQVVETYTQNTVNKGMSTWEQYNVIDNGYINVLVSFGPIILCSVVLLFAIWAYKALSEKDTMTSICIIVLSIDFAMTLFMCLVMHNPFILLAISSMVGRRIKSTKEVKGYEINDREEICKN